ncbi:TPA: glycosyltransferase [Legionella pneumophila]|nr:glycosyltransferase [Legionella pneumophila]
MKYSVIIPVYKNEASIKRLLETLTNINNNLNGQLEVVFVVDGSPDLSFELIRDAMPKLNFQTQLLAHSRNFGSFPAIRTDLKVAQGKYFAVMAADLQEPPELLEIFFTKLAADECDVIIGTRTGRKDPLLSRIFSGIFWRLYRRFVVRDMPKGGVDVFGCNNSFREELLKLEESHSSLIALIFWLGFRRVIVGYERQLRQEGKSSWTLSKKLEYMMDSIFAFTDYPIRLLIRVGATCSILSFLGAIVIFTARVSNLINVPGYAALMIAVLFLGSVNLLALGLVGSYSWRGYENSKQRPIAIVAKKLINKKVEEYGRIKKYTSVE